jgi:hypothetical protein
MALRLVTPATPNQVAQAPVADGGVVARTVMAAKQLLLDRDHTAWREAFAATAGIVDEHDRYIARRTMLESVLASQGFATHVLSQMFTSAAAVLTDLLEENPLEPVLLNTAGVLYFELGSTKAAEALFRAAQRLDPALPDVAGNLRACKQRRKNKSNLTASLPPAVQRELRELGPRAERIGKRAQPPTDQTLSLCMIVKDEQQMLPQCLDAIAGFVDELIIVDTGSTDDTVQIAESYGAKVLHHKWTGDFSEARNVGFDAATCDWKMFLDADEVLVDGEGPKLRELLGHTWREAIYLVETNYTGELDHGTSRTPYRRSLSASRSHRSASTTLDTSAWCERSATSHAATSSCSSSRWPRGTPDRSCGSTSGLSTWR